MFGSGIVIGFFVETALFAGGCCGGEDACVAEEYVVVDVQHDVGGFDVSVGKPLAMKEG